MIPGHGDAGDQAFVRAQSEEMVAMAELCRRVLRGEIGAEEAVTTAPFPERFAWDALERSAATTPQT